METACCGEGGAKDLFVSVVGDFVACHQVERGEHEDRHDEVVV